MDWDYLSLLFLCRCQFIPRIEEDRYFLSNAKYNLVFLVVGFGEMIVSFVWELTLVRLKTVCYLLVWNATWILY